MLEKLLVTGAAGGIARLVTGSLGTIAKSVRLSDIVEPNDIEPGAEFVRCDLGDEAAVSKLVEGCDGILHLGGISIEQDFRNILDGNIVGLHNLYEAARAHGYPRIFQASSNHVIGFYRQNERLDAYAPHKPDSWYGVSKSFGEAVALMYYHKFGQQTAIVRIGSCRNEPEDHRMLATWLAPEDFVSLVERVFSVPLLGCPVIYGMSDNDIAWWDNSCSSYLGWRPKKSSSEFAAKLNASVPVPCSTDPTSVYQGGIFTALPIVKE